MWGCANLKRCAFSDWVANWVTSCPATAAAPCFVAHIVDLVQRARVIRHSTMTRGALYACIMGIMGLLHSMHALCLPTQKYRRAATYDMVNAWDLRARKFYGDRFDFRRNMVGCLRCDDLR